MKRSHMMFAVAAILAVGVDAADRDPIVATTCAAVVGISNQVSADAEDSRKIETRLPENKWSNFKSEKVSGVYWLYEDSPREEDGVRILLESGAKFKVSHADDFATVTREIVDTRDIVVPDMLGGKRVTDLDERHLFECCWSMESITIPNGVTNYLSDAEVAFNPLGECLALKKIVVAKDHPTYTIHDGILYDKTGKVLLCCPAGREGDVVVPDGVEMIGSAAFENCSRIRSLTIPPSVRTVRNAFMSLIVPGCSGLRAIYISDLAAWCGIRFFTDDSNPLRQARNLYLNGKLVTDVVIPDGVESVGDSAFIGCTSLRSVSLPRSVTNIGHSAFLGCRELNKVKIRGGVKSIGWCAFEDCTSLREIEIPDSVTSIGECAFENCTSLKEIEIPDSVASIGNPVDSSYSLKSGIFNGCVSLRQVVLPKALREIPENAFFGCVELEEVEISKGVERIGTGAFYGCKCLRDVEIPKGVKELGVMDELDFDIKGVFEGCGLREIEIPDSVKTIGQRAFAGCADLSCVKMGSGFKSIGKAVFDGCNELKFDAKHLPGFKMRSGIIVERTAPLGETLDLTGTKGISADALGSNLLYDDETDPELAKLRHVIFPDGMETINLETFIHCGNLQELTIPPSVTEVYFKKSFGVASCFKHLKKVNIRDLAAWCKIDFFVEVSFSCSYYGLGHPGVPGGSSNPIADGAAALYLNGKRMTEIVVPGSVEQVGKGAFYRYGALESVVIEDGVKSIGDHAFCGCTNLVSITIPNSVTNIGDQAFLGCTKLKSIKAPESIEIKIDL